MKKFFIICIGLSCFSAFAADKSLDCKFTKNSKNIPLTFSYGDDYEEENTEIYEAKDGDVSAHVLYLPYQYGIFASMKAKDAYSESVGDADMTMSMTQNGDTYSLSCRKL